MEKYLIGLEGGKMVELELSTEQLEKIGDNMQESRSTPLYSTTYAKAKYGDCLIGNIISIKKI